MVRTPIISACAPTLHNLVTFLLTDSGICENIAHLMFCTSKIMLYPRSPNFNVDAHIDGSGVQRCAIISQTKRSPSEEEMCDYFADGKASLRLRHNIDVGVRGMSRT